jgi:hypothetical protein
MESVLAAYALGAAALAVGLVALLHVLEPEFDPSWRMPSEYSLGRYGVLMRLAFIAGGTAVIGVGAALASVASPANIGLLVVALGPIGAAFIDTDPVTTPRASFSTKGNIHGALGSLFILGFPIVATIVGIGAAGDASVGPRLALAAVAPWAGLIWFIATTLRHAPADGRGSPAVPIGWPIRVTMLAYFGWVALAAVTVLT